MKNETRAIYIKPNTKNGKVNTKPFICEDCSLSYARDDYKILHGNRKLVYFLLYPNWAKQDEHWLLCHDCLTKSIMRICEENELPILTLKLKDGRKWFDLDFFYDDDDESPVDPVDLDLF